MIALRLRTILRFAGIVLAASVLAACGGSPDESSARAAVEDLRGGEFMRSGSVDQFGIDTVTVEGECAVVRIIELPRTYETSIFLRWQDGEWVGTNIVTGHGSPILATADDCFRED